MSFGKVIPVTGPWSNRAENELVWSGCVEIRRHAKAGSVSYTARLTFENGDGEVERLFREHLTEFVERLPDRLGA